MAGQGDGDRPWWLRLDGMPPSDERRLRTRWPDWDELTREERLRREFDWQRRRRRDWLARHPVLTVVIGVLFIVVNLLNVVAALGAANLRWVLIGLRFAYTLVVLVIVGYLLRELHRARRE